MDPAECDIYKQQLGQINQALISCPSGEEREELLILKSNIEELLSLSSSDDGPSSTPCLKDPLSNEFALFMAEMEKEGAVERSTESAIIEKLDELKEIEGMKCRAPHTHQWGHVAYHNAMVCSVVTSEDITDVEEIKVRVLFINPTHQEMLPCPYYYESDCKFSEEKCRFSHGEVVLYSSLQEYVEPKFHLLTTGSPVLAKQSNNLWYRAIIRKIYDEKCVVKFESNRKEVEVILEHVFPLDNDENIIGNDEYESSGDERREEDRNEDIINMSLMNTPSNEALGNWEQFTKGIGSKLMQKMGYIVGTGLGKNSDGRIDPVTAVILPSGKSLDHCMRLREEAGDDKDLFSVERKLKKLQKKQEMQSRKNYERETKKRDVFNFINQTLAEGSHQKQNDRLDERQKLKKECSRSLNIRSLQIADNIRRIERDLEKLRDSLGRHTDVLSDIHLKLKDKLVYRQDQLKMYQAQATMIRNEQSVRNDKKKMTVF